MSSQANIMSPNFSSTFHNKHSEVYDRMALNCTLSIAIQIVPLLPPITSTSYILDNSCGTGFVTSVLKYHHPSVPIKGLDLAAGMIDSYNKHAADHDWKNVEGVVGDCRKLEGLDDGSFSHVVTNFGFAPDLTDLGGPGRAAKEMWRVLREGGCAVVSVWKERNFDAALEAAALRVRPDETPFSWSNAPKEWEEAPWLEKQLLDAGFGRVEIKEMHGGQSAKTFDEYVDNLLLMKMMFYKGYSEEELEKLRPILKEEVQKLGAYYEKEEEVGVKMVAWVAFATK